VQTTITTGYSRVKASILRQELSWKTRQLPLGKWLLVTNRKGVSSVNLAEQLGITQRSAWFVSMRIKAVFKIENNDEQMFSEDSICEAELGRLFYF
jgi:hypothetical protein